MAQHLPDECAILEALRALEQAPIMRFELSALDAWVLACNLQLALKHPNNTGPTAQRIHALCEGLIEQLAPEGALRVLYEYAWLEDLSDGLEDH